MSRGWLKEVEDVLESYNVTIVTRHTVTELNIAAQLNINNLLFQKPLQYSGFEKFKIPKSPSF